MKVNPVLKQITASIYRSRPPMRQDQRTNYRIERANGGFLCDLWFLTVGCVHDMHGGCVMCNYGKGEGAIDQNRIVEELRDIVNRLNLEYEDFLLTPSGSMLDEREVSCEMREQLAVLLRDVRAKRFIIETRADTITDAGLEFVRNVMPGAEKYVEIGLESSNDWILKYCVNKEATFTEFRKAVDQLHESGIRVIANIGLGIPFMTERAAIREAVHSARDAMDVGVDSIVLFPYHIKSGTLLESMYQNGMYTTVSLWALAEVLGNFSEDELERIQISWYKDYFPGDFSFIKHSPDTCPECREQVLELLDRYRDLQDPECVRQLIEYLCACRMVWKENQMNQSEEIQIDRVIEDYHRLAELYSIDRDILKMETQTMRREFARS